MSPIKLVKKILEWSFSRWKQYENCPLSAKLKFIDKIEVADTRAQAGGSSMHALAEEWASKIGPDGKPSKMKTIPAILAPFKKEFEVLRKSKVKVIVERELDPFKNENKREFATFAWGITKDWKLCGFFEKGVVWCRIKVDTHLYDHEKKQVRIIDYKSGRKYPDDHEKQLELYAVGAFIRYPEAQTVVVEMWYIDQQEIEPKVYDRRDFAELKAVWNNRIIPMFNDTHFVARPGKHCSWCSYGVSKGGTCAHG